jgi:hypothetical protein
MPGHGAGGISFLSKFGTWNYQKFAPVLVYQNNLNSRSDFIAEGA